MVLRNSEGGWGVGGGVSQTPKVCKGKYASETGISRGVRGSKEKPSVGEEGHFLEQHNE